MLKLRRAIVLDVAIPTLDGSSDGRGSAQAPEQQPQEEPAAPAPQQLPTSGAGDLDGARLIALNMALNGQSREDAERYLAAHFQSIDRLKLIDEVYAAIEG